MSRENEDNRRRTNRVGQCEKENLSRRTKREGGQGEEKDRDSRRTWRIRRRTEKRTEKDNEKFNDEKDNEIEKIIS